MRIPEVVETLQLGMEEKIAVHMWGAPGIGKSDIVKQLGKDTGRNIVDLRMGLLNPVDLRGVPVPKDGKTAWWAPAFLPSDPDDTSIVFLDELNCAPPSVQAAAYQLILDRKVGEYTLPKGCDIIAAGNRGTDRAIVHDMPSPLRNRFLHVEVEPNLDDWKDWAIENDIHSAVISFLNFKSNYLFFFDHKKHTRGFPTPRSWAMVSKIVTKLGVSSCTKRSELIEGLVGEGVASEFCAFLKIAADLPSIDEILVKGRTDINLSNDPSTLYAFCGALVSGITRITGKDEFTAAKNFCKFAATLSPEFGFMTVSDYTRSPRFKNIRSKLAGTQEWAACHAKFGHLI